MTVTLTHEEREFLAQVLKLYLGAVRLEIARTDSRQFKAQLRRHEAIAQGVLERLGSDLIPANAQS